MVRPDHIATVKLMQSSHSKLKQGLFYTTVASNQAYLRRSATGLASSVLPIKRSFSQLHALRATMVSSE
jgi:hypothetical protein